MDTWQIVATIAAVICAIPVVFGIFRWRSRKKQELQKKADVRIDKVVDAFCKTTTRDPGGVHSFIHSGAALLQSSEEVVKAVERIRLRGFKMHPLPYVEKEIPQDQWLDFLRWYTKKQPELKYYYNPTMFAELKEMYFKDKNAQP